MKSSSVSSRNSSLNAALFMFSTSSIMLALFFLGVFQEYWSVVLGVLSIVIVRIFFPSFSFQRMRAFSLVNLAYGLFLLQILVLPILSVRNGVARNVLPFVPSAHWLEIAYLINVLAFISFAAGYHILSARYSLKMDSFSDTMSWQEPRFMQKLIVVYIFIGLVGYWLRYESIGNYFSIATDTVSSQNNIYSGSNFLAAASTFFQPFLASGIVIWWTIRVQRQIASGRKSVSYLSLIWILTVILILTLNYNRGGALSVLLPIIGVFFTTTRKLTIPIAILGIVGLFMFVMVWGGGFGIDFIFRSDNIFVVASESQVPLVEFVQIYAGGSQLNAFLLQMTGFEDRLYLGKTLLSSILYPVPILGELFRSSSGVVLFNRLIHGRPDIIDQVIPFSGELMINFHIVGVIIGFTLFGAVVSWIQAKAYCAENLFEIFIWFSVGVWVLFLIPGSLAVASQAVVFFFWPFYIYFILKHFFSVSLVSTATLNSRE